MSLKHGILGFLNYGDLTGYELNKAFNSSVGYFWNATSSQVYRELEWLEKHGFVEYEKVIQKDKPNKKVFSITAEGKQEFLSWLTNPQYDAFFNMRNAFLMQMFFSGEQSLEQSVLMLDTFIQEMHTKMEITKLEANESIQKYKRNVNDATKSMYWELTSDFGFRYLETCLHWAKDAKKKLLEEIANNNAK